MKRDAIAPAPPAVPRPDPGAPEFVRLARRVAGGIARRSGLAGHADDLASAALVGLVEAARSYDPGHPGSASFETHAINRIRGAVLDEARKIRGHGLGGMTRAVRRGEFAAVVSLDAERAEPTRSGRPASLADVLPSGDLPVGWELESEDAVAALAARLPPGLAGLVRRRYLDAGCASGAAAARRLGIAPASVHTRTWEARAILAGRRARA